MAKDIYERLIWLNGKIIKANEAKINILSPSFQYGLNVFEGIRCYWNNNLNQLYGFRLKEHFKRLKQSQRLLQIEDKFTIDEMEKAIKEIVIANKYKEDIYIRQTIFVEGFGSWASREPAGMFIAPIIKTALNKEYQNKGLNCCVTSWKRINDNSLSPMIKCGANYINSRMAQLEAIKNGYDTAIFLNDNGSLSEGPGSCLFLVKNGVIVTPSISENILDSITRDTVIHIAKDQLHIEVQERRINKTELYICDEAFLCGTAMEITPIFSVDKYLINDGKIGKITNLLQMLYVDIVRNNKCLYPDWLTPIY
jgi:branched-chain amino acid aminotransferase